MSSEFRYPTHSVPKVLSPALMARYMFPAGTWITGTFHRGSPVGVYMQIYNAGIDQTTLRPSVDVEYALIKDGKELGKQAEDWRGNSDAGQRLTLTRLIDSRQLVPGDYTLEVRVRDHVSGQSLKQQAKFSVLQ